MRHPCAMRLPVATITITRNMRIFFIADPFYINSTLCLFLMAIVQTTITSIMPKVSCRHGRDNMPIVQDKMENMLQRSAETGKDIRCI